MIEEMPNKVRSTRVDEAPACFHLSAIQPPAISPTKPEKNMMNTAPPICLMSKPCTFDR